LTKEKPIAIIDVFGYFAEWYDKTFLQTGKGVNMKDLGRVFTHKFKPFVHRKFGTHIWKVALNGQESELHDPIGNSGIAPYTMHVYRNDWLVAICTPLKGTGVYGLDKQFIELLKYLLKRKRKEQLEAKHERKI
jgi:hypothetical protein